MAGASPSHGEPSFEPQKEHESRRLGGLAPPPPCGEVAPQGRVGVAGLDAVVFAAADPESARHAVDWLFARMAPKRLRGI